MEKCQNMMSQVVSQDEKKKSEDLYKKPEYLSSPWLVPSIFASQLLAVSPANAANPYDPAVPKGFEDLASTNYGFPQNFIELLKSFIVGLD